MNRKTAAYSFIGILVLVAVLAFILRPAQEPAMPQSEAVVQQNSIEPEPETQLVEEAPAAEDMISETESAATADTVSEDGVTSEEKASSTAQPAGQAPLPDEDILEVKALGDPNAPVVIEEFSSLTCGHCGVFHKDTFSELESEFIDTGKVYYIYHEFPLNGPALDGALLARCMQGERYWTFTNLLFETQKTWAFTQDHRSHLRQNAKLAGLSDDEIDGCLNDEKRAEALAKRSEFFADKYGINATPTFVINRGEATLVGNQPLTVFKTAIEAAADNKGDKSDE